ncbi:MAG: pitrilysin family protein, partial [Chitinophagaceae bacterium]
DQVMEYNGGSNNAYTTNDVTVYTNWFPASALPVIFELEADRLSTLRIDSAMVESERGVVLSERSTGLENSPWRLLSENMEASAFQDGPYHWPVIGYEQDIKNWTKSDLEYYFKTYYAPNNCVVVVSGNIRFDEVKTLAEKYLEPIPAQPTPKPVHLIETVQKGERRITVQKEVASPYLGVAFHVPEAGHKDYFALDILSSVLSGGNSSRLYSALVDKKALASAVFTSFGATFNPSLFAVFATTSKDKKVEDLEQAVYVELEKVKKTGITEAELQKVKNQKLMEFYNQVETINGKSNNLGTYEVFFDDYRKMFTAPEAYNKVSTADIKRVANEYFKKSTRTVGILKSNVED